jgi:hypothetical protein
LKRALEKLVNTRQNDWDVLLKHVLFAYRTSEYASTKYTPFYLMFGRKARIPVELDLPSDLPISVASTDFDSELEPEDKMEKYINNLLGVRDDVYQHANHNIKVAQEKQKKDYDRRNCVTQHNFIVGSKVLMKNRKNDHRMGGTLEKNWIGPYEIIEVFSKGTMKLKNCLTEKILKTVQHASNLKPYLESEQQGETRNVTEYDTEKAAVTDAQENTANEQAKPRTKRLRLDSKIKGKNIKLLNKSLVYSLLSRHNFSG